MEKEIRCPHCGGNRYEQVGNGVCKCSYCGSTFTIGIQPKVEKEARTELEQKPSHFLTINWKGIFALYDAPMNLTVNGVRYNHAFLRSGFAIKVPLESVMNICLSCGNMSSSWAFSIDTNFDYEMELEYSWPMKNWFCSYTVYKKGVNGEYVMVRNGELENENPSGKIARGCSIAALVICILFLIFLFWIYNSIPWF